MERQNNTKAQQNIKYRLLACVVAVALAIGLSAMPALAEPSEDASGSISIVSVDTSTDAKAEKADAPKGESGTSDSSSKILRVRLKALPISQIALLPSRSLYLLTC